MVMPREVKTVKTEEEDEKMLVEDEPVSPTGQYFTSSALSVAILGVFEFEVPIDDSAAWSTLERLFLPINPRFSSIMIKDENGTKQWKRVNVNLKDHIQVPVFPSGLESYEECVSNYLTKISMEQFPQNKPLWNLHIIKYPTSNSQGSLVFKLHHALGDGFSLMAALFSSLQRADDPSLPLTFPSSKSNARREKANGVMSIINTVRDFGWSLLKSNLLEDDKSPVRSGTEGVEFMPMTITSVEFSLDDIREIKMRIGGTINDVITGIIFYGTQLYLHSAAQRTSKASQVTALILLNTRIIGNYQPLNEMIKHDAKSPWGNQFAFLHVSIPNYDNLEKIDPLEFVKKARQVIKQKKSSLAVYLTGRLLETLRRFIGPEGTAKYIHATLRNTSMTISNLTGPMEQMLIANHPIRSFHFMVVGSPQSLTITIVSYMGKLKVAMGVEQGYIDPKLLVSCMKQSFERIFETATGKISYER